MSYTKKFNETLDKALETLGINSKNQEKDIYDKEEMRGKVNNLMKHNSDKSEQQRKIEAEEFLNSLDRIIEEAKHTGKMKERMKGQDSDAVYNMLVLIIIANLATVGMLAWVHFV